MSSIKRKCPCCGYLTLEEAKGDFDICPVCFWEDDPVQNENPDFGGGANHVSLNEAKRNYINIGASDERFIEYVREPYVEECNEQ